MQRASNRFLLHHPLFTGGVIDKPDWRPVTRFEGQGIDKDHAVNDMMYVKA